MTHRSHTHLYRKLIVALISAGAFWAGSASAQVPTTDGAHIGVQIEQWVRNYEQWTEEFNRWTQQFQQNAITQITNLTGVVGLGGSWSNKDPKERAKQYQQTIDDFKANNRCLRMSENLSAAKNICQTRHNLQVAKLEKLIELLKYTDGMNDQIQAASNAVDRVDGKNNPAEAAQKMRALQALQNELKDGVAQKSKEFESYDLQINMLKEQQAELARVVLQGKPSTTVGSVVQAVSMVGAFKAIKSTSKAQAGAKTNY